MTPSPASLLVLNTCPDQETAKKLAKLLVEQKLAACVSLTAPLTSIYRWEGQVEQAEEIQLLIKTQRDCYPALEAAIQANHPYTVPEIIALPIETGLPAYLDWLQQETRRP